MFHSKSHTYHHKKLAFVARFAKALDTCPPVTCQMRRHPPSLGRLESQSQGCCELCWNLCWIDACSAVLSECLFFKSCLIVRQELLLEGVQVSHVIQWSLLWSIVKRLPCRPIVRVMLSSPPYEFCIRRKEKWHLTSVHRLFAVICKLWIACCIACCHSLWQGKTGETRKSALALARASIAVRLYYVMRITLRTCVCICWSIYTIVHITTHRHNWRQYISPAPINVYRGGGGLQTFFYTLWGGPILRFLGIPRKRMYKTWGVL